MKTISVLSPCFNEEDNVENCYRAVQAIFAEHLPTYRCEHIFVDNASTDGTVAVLRRLAQDDPWLKVIVNSRNFGLFRSSFNGLRYATGDAVVVMLPVDLQDPPELIPTMVEHWENGIEVVAGARSTREESRTLRILRGAFYRIVNALSDFEIPPDVGEFQLIDRKVLDAVLSHSNHYPYIRGIIASCGFKRLIIPYTWKARARGVSKFNMPILIDQALNGIFSFTRAPIRISTFIGVAIAICCILFSIAAVVMYFISPPAAPRGTMTIIVALFFLSGVQLVFIGILGEYVTSLHTEIRGGPLVVETERINVAGSGAGARDRTTSVRSGTDDAPPLPPIAHGR